MTMPLVPDTPEISKILLFGNIFTCCYLQLILFYLYYSNKLFKFGETENISVLYSIIGLEIIKYALFGVPRAKTGRSKDSGFIRDFLKTLFVYASMVVIYYATAVIFGAPLWSEWTETFMFSLLLTSISILPSCLNLGPDNTMIALKSLSVPSFNSTINHFMFIFKLTVFGAWLGAVVIPLDWDRPWQVWPIPCCIGSLAGCLVGNLYSVFNQVKPSSISAKSNRTRKQI